MLNRTIYMLPNQNLIQITLSMHVGYLVVTTTTYTKDLTWACGDQPQNDERTETEEPTNSVQPDLTEKNYKCCH